MHSNKIWVHGAYDEARSGYDVALIKTETIRNSFRPLRLPNKTMINEDQLLKRAYTVAYKAKVKKNGGDFIFLLFLTNLC